MLRVAVVGSGPSGCYAAQSLVQQDPDVLVDVLDRLPCPYGLVRYGVAPDHEKIKSLQNNLRAVLEHERVRFLGGVRVGPDGVGAARLRELYHAVVYCVGAAADRRLGIPGEELRGSWSATEFVSWYSAHPDATAGAFDGPALGARTAVVIGVGNVAVDVTRMLARGATELSPTDMPQAALASLAASEITRVHMVGRRGPSHARFTTKELRELSTLPDTRVDVNPAELELDPDYVDPSSLPAARRRNVEVLRGWATAPAPSGRRRIRLRFFLRPVEILADGDRVCGVRLERTEPDAHGGLAAPAATRRSRRSWSCARSATGASPSTASPSTRPAARSRTAPGACCATAALSRRVRGGWIKRGPTGVIGTNRPCAKETATSLLQDAPELAAGRVPDDPVAALRAEGCEPVEWWGWEAIERAEAALGASLGRGVVKLPDWESLMTAARTGRH